MLFIVDEVNDIIRELDNLSCTSDDNVVDEEKFGTQTADKFFDQISVPLAPEERVVNAIACSGGISFTTVVPSELGAVPEEDEEAATSSSPSTVVSSKI